MYQKDFSSTAVDILRLIQKDVQERDKIALITLFLRAIYKNGWDDSLNQNFDNTL
jgi:hypothetical protein